MAIYYKYFPIVFWLAWFRSMGISQTLTISSTTDTVSESQSIWVNATLRNTSNHTVLVPPYILSEFDPGIQFQLFSSKGDTIKQISFGIADYFGIPEPDSLTPNDSLTSQYDILSLFANINEEHAPSYLSSMSYLSKGIYILSATVFTLEDVVYSNKFIFVVREPPNNELQPRLDLREAENNYLKDNDKAIILFTHFIKRYPTSIYTPQAYKHLIWLMYEVKHDVNQSLNLVLELATNFPDHLISVSELSGNYSLFLKNGNQTSILNLSKKFPETRVGKFCKMKLISMKKY